MALVHRGNQIFPAFCGLMDVGQVSSPTWEGTTCLVCLSELPQPEWRKFDKDDETTWPSENGSYWVSYFDEHLKRYIVASDHWASTHWLVSKREFWQPIVVPSAPTEGEE